MVSETSSVAGRAVCFDASALVKLYVNESDHEKVRAVFRAEPTKYTTPFCFYETLSVLKGRIGTNADQSRYLSGATIRRAHGDALPSERWRMSRAAARKCTDQEITPARTTAETRRARPAELRGLARPTFYDPIGVPSCSTGSKPGSFTFGGRTNTIDSTRTAPTNGNSQMNTI